MTEERGVYGKRQRKGEAGEPIEKSHFEDPRQDVDLKMSRIAVISTIRRFY